MTVEFVTFTQAAERIPDNAVVTVSSSSGLGCPDRMLRAIGEHFEHVGHPCNLTTLHPIAAGDVYGIKGVDHIAKDGLLSRIIAGSYPSGPSSKPMPEIWRMITEDRVQAYNVPSGILFDMHREVAARRPGVLTKVGLDTFVDPHHEGSVMNASAAKQPIVERVQFNDDSWLFFPNIVPNVAIIRATTADELGNLTYEHEGAYLGVLEQAIAVKNQGGLIIAQVKRVAAMGTLRPYDVHVPTHLVDLVVVDPEQQQTTGIAYDPTISGELTTPLSEFKPHPHSIEKVIARRAAMELQAGQTANLGFGMSTMLPGILIEEGLAHSITWVIEQGAVGGVPLTDFAFGCAANAEAILPSTSQFIYFQGGGFDIAFLSFLEIDVEGNVNVSKLAKRPYLTAGCGGFVDITAHARKIIFSGLFEISAELELSDSGLQVVALGKISKMVTAVEQITFSGLRARDSGQDVLYITERCVMRLDEKGLVAVEIMPGINPQRDIIDASEGRVRVASDAIEMPHNLLHQKPMGLTL
ncbi:MAG: CoA-transferase [Gammaproteobacteria bacterium]|jgi:acyl CoA:acetate/3-ketoacid CoA transferase|nr:CoA-transferase [Gammaproteobacteria bacterium]